MAALKKIQFSNCQKYGQRFYIPENLNIPFKHAIREQFEKHLSENLHRYTENKLPVSERRMLTTKWVAEGWEKVSRNKETIKRHFA